MNPLEHMIARLARSWLELRQRARVSGGGLFYWFFGYLGFCMAALFMVQIVQRKSWLSFPWDFLVPGVLALLWVRGSWYRLHPVKTFLATLVLCFFAELQFGL